MRQLLLPIMYPSFIMRWDELNVYDCSLCKSLGREHKVINVPGPTTTDRSHWGGGLPTTMRQCTGCGHEDGPWVSSDLVGGGW